MSEITVDKKLQLINQVRSQYNKDQYDLLHREQLLYGRTSERRRPDVESMPVDNIAMTGKTGTFRIRLLAALGLFFLILILDMSKTSLFGLQMSQVFDYIAEDVDASGWEAAMNDIVETFQP